MAQPLFVGLSGPGWHAELEVRTPEGTEPVTKEFEVAPLGPGPGPTQHIAATVLYTEAANRLATGWQRWHVKVYRCATQGESEALRLYLRRQAVDVQHANAALEGPSRIPIEPPWAVVPVHIVRGDGQQDRLDSVQTVLAATPEELMVRVRATLPSWFTDHIPSPELYLMAVSPYLERLAWPPLRPWPAVEHLVGFAGMAAGLDTLHRLGMIHCDIKPDNVCRYHTERSAGYVLIDVDAATRLAPLPTALRSTKLYEYHGLRRGRLDAGVLRAHDRFGFALVVLTALAGRDWVERVLLLSGERLSPRPADDPHRVRDALRHLWTDTDDRRWDPLIDALTEPFGPGVEAESWSARAWVDRLLAAERRCVPAPEPAFTTLPRGRPERFASDLARVRADANARIAPGPDRIRNGYAAVQRRAEAVAVRHAAKALATWGGGLIGVLLLVLCALRLTS